MFTINVEGENLSVLFKNDQNAMRLGKHGFEPVEQISAIILGDDNIARAIGIALKSADDEPNDILGMELALGRALKDLTVNKYVRSEFWRAFYRAVEEADQTDEEAFLDALDTNRLESFDYESGLESGPSSFEFTYQPGEAMPTQLEAQKALLAPTVYKGEAPIVSNVIPFVKPNAARIMELQSIVDNHNYPGCSSCDSIRRQIAELERAA